MYGKRKKEEGEKKKYMENKKEWGNMDDRDKWKLKQC